jgi:hypothetical protein
MEVVSATTQSIALVTLNLTNFISCSESTRLPTAIRDLFANKEVSSAHAVTLGAEESFFISYKGNDGSNYVCMFLNI